MWKATTITTAILGLAWYSHIGENLKSISCEDSLHANTEMKSIIYLHQELHKDKAYPEDEATPSCI